MGIRLDPGQSHTIGSSRFGQLKGLPFSWPKGVPQDCPVDERLLFILTSAAADLWHLSDSVGYNSARRGRLSNLERLTSSISTGSTRDLGKQMESETVLFDVLHLPILLCPPALAQTELDRHRRQGDNSATSAESATSDEYEEGRRILSELPSPDDVTESRSLSALPPHLDPNQKGLVGALIRTGKGIPPCVWVVNRHTEPIVVVVSKYRPNRLLTGVDLNASATGAGFGLTSTTFQCPATRKTIPPRRPDPKASIAVFPLWTRKEGFGVVTVFKESEQTPFIENDRIPAGATAYFVDGPDLKIVEYGSEYQEQ